MMVKRLFCWAGWHSWSYEPMFYDGCSQHSRCRWCGYEGMVDSQGNLF
jgi:hypothetical protein